MEHAKITDIVGMLTTTKYLPDLGGLTASDEWSFSSVSRANTSTLTHSYHRYPAKFIPQLVDKLIQQYTKEGDLVVDPSVTEPGVDG